MRAFSILACVTLLTGGCTTVADTSGTAHSKTVSDAVQSPFEDVGLLRPDAPEVLKKAVNGVYDLPQNLECAAIQSEIRQLDAVLGPDLDASDGLASPTIDAGAAASAMIGDALQLPFRGVVRWMSGADAREKAIARAILSGMVRRAFLKGVLNGATCRTSENL